MIFKRKEGIYIYCLLINLVLVCEAIVSNDVLLNSINSNNNKNSYNGHATCEEITVPMCRNLPYNMTHMPNQFNHETQQDAALEVHQFWALVEINCSKDLKFFLCSMYTPICIENYAQPVRACKSVCERARNGCEKYMKKFGFEWPEHMNCNLFPQSAKDVCMDPMDAESTENNNDDDDNQQTQQLKPKFNSPINSFINTKQQQQQQPAKVYSVEDSAPFFKQNIDVDLNKVCLNPLIKITDFTDSRYNKISTGNLLNCVRPCRDKYFSDSEYQFSFYWILFWSILCFLSSFSTTLTYLIETNRFKYPEKPILYLSICYLFVSIGFILKYIIGHDRVACELDGSIKHIISSSRNTTGTSTILCTLIFILIYYFSMASAVWWVIISLTWFLAAGLKWGIESISKYSYYFHLIAWLLPAFKTILILTLGYVDADSLSGICYVGNTNLKSLKMFIIIPIFIYLAIGITFLLLGFISLFRLRNLIKQQQGQAKTNKLEKLMLRIGIFSILYTIPATCLISCYFYEQYYRIEWEQNYICNRQLAESGTAANISLDCMNTRKPEFLIFMLKYFSILIIGVTSGFWIWTTKTVISWKKFLTSCCHLNKKKQKLSKRDSVIYFQASNEIENHNHDNTDQNDNLNQMYQFNRINENNRQDVDTNYCNIATGSTIGSAMGIGTEDTIFTGSVSNSNVGGYPAGTTSTSTTTAMTSNNIITTSSLSSDSTISNSYTLMSSNYPQFPMQICHNNRATYFYNDNNFYNQSDNIRFMVPPALKFPLPSPNLNRK